MVDRSLIELALALEGWLENLGKQEKKDLRKKKGDASTHSVFTQWGVDRSLAQ